MIDGRVQVVDPDSVDAELLHEGRIAETEGSVAEGIDAGIGFEA